MRILNNQPSQIWTRAPDNFQVQRVITPYFWKWWVFAYFLCTVVLSTSEKIAYMYKFLIVSSVSSDSIVKGIIDDIIKMAVKTVEVDEQKIVSN
jgi:hypothetical protein